MEAAKLVDAAKKGYFYGKPNDLLNGMGEGGTDASMCKGGSLDHIDVGVIHAILGMISEAAELGELLAKAIETGAPIDEKELVLEAGDSLWYTQLLANRVGCGLDGFIDENVKKLTKRFPNVEFSTEAALARKDME